MLKDNNKETFLQIRIQKDLKKQFSDLIKEDGDTVSGFLTRTITKYVNTHKKP